MRHPAYDRACHARDCVGIAAKIHCGKNSTSEIDPASGDIDSIFERSL